VGRDRNEYKNTPVNGDQRKEKKKSMICFARKNKSGKKRKYIIKGCRQVVPPGLTAVSSSCVSRFANWPRRGREELSI
jgi:hypothetical protein